MVDVKHKIKTVADRCGITKHGAVLSAIVMILLAVCMTAMALFAPYKYYSTQSVLHILHIDDEETEEVQADVYVAQSIAVHQSVFRVFSAAGALGDASTLHAFYTKGVMPKEPERLEDARKRLNNLRKQYEEIYQETVKYAHSAGLVIGGEKFAEELAKNLSHMNIMELDLLEMATLADNEFSYNAMYAACIVGLFSGIFNILTVVLSAVTIIISILNIVTKRNAFETPILLRLYVIFSAVATLLCLFNTAVPPASGPLAMCCTVVSVFYLMGLVKSVTSDGSGEATIRNGTVGALIPIGMIVLAATPSFIMYLNGLGGKYLFYGGTIGTTYFSWVDATSVVGLDIPHGIITEARILGIILSVIAVVCADRALVRLYRDAQEKSVLLPVVAFIAFGVGLAVIISAAAVTAEYQAAGTLVKYIAGASWYVCAALMLIGGLFGLLFKLKSAGNNVSIESSADNDGEKVEATIEALGE